MSAMIRATCQWCGDVELPAEAARLDIPPREGQSGVVRFDCPGCGRTAVQEVADRATRLLLQAGVGVAVGDAADVPRGPGAPRSDRHP